MATRADGASLPCTKRGVQATSFCAETRRLSQTPGFASCAMLLCGRIRMAHVVLHISAHGVAITPSIPTSAHA